MVKLTEKLWYLAQEGFSMELQQKEAQKELKKAQKICLKRIYS